MVPTKKKFINFNSNCTKGFPKEFRNETIFLKDGYSEYKRRNNTSDNY